MQPYAGKILLTALLFSQVVAAQVLPQDSLQRMVNIQAKKEGNHVQFSAATPSLQQVAGAPQAFYTYFWEFGDGQYSMDENPSHTYREKGDYTAEVWVTNHYDNGKPPPGRPEKITIENLSLPADSANKQVSIPNGFSLQKNREPVPNEKMVIVMTYENTNTYTADGKLYLFFNEKKYKADNFKLLEVRTYHGETTLEDEPVLTASLPENNTNTMVASAAREGILHFTFPNDTSERKDLEKTKEYAKSIFRSKSILQFNDMKPGEQRNVFFIIETTPEMLQDTSAIINIRGVFVPDRNFSDHKVKDLEMEISTSHDPNKMAVYDTRVNYRFFPGKKLKYKVRFQNNGEGPARTIRLEIDVPPTIDNTSLNVLDLYPKCPICPDSTEVSYSCLDTVFLENKMTLTFKNIHLPGSRQKGVHEYDSTKGFVQYSLVMNKKVPKVNSISRTAIVFDKNEPILTNYARTRFKPGVSAGVLGGYTHQPALSASRNYIAGVTLSPFKPYKGFFQMELITTVGSYSSVNMTEVRDSIEQGLDQVVDITRYRTLKNVSITLVPISYRYNLLKFLSVGGGVQVSTKLTESISGKTDFEYYVQFKGAEKEPNPGLNRTMPIDGRRTFVGLVPGAFADLNIGSVRIGPTAGVRYIYQTEAPTHQWMFYLLWKL